MTVDQAYLEDAARRRLPLSRPITTLGRSPACDLFIPDRRTSRRHAEIRWDGESYTLRDLDSANGTFLNGRCLTTPETLRDGDEIAIASATFTFHDPESTLRVAEFPLLVVDKASGEIWVNRRPIALSPKEQALFDFLYENAGRACSKQEIAAVVWPEYHVQACEYQVESLIKRLREKLELDPREPALVITVRGRGYKLLADR